VRLWYGGGGAVLGMFFGGDFIINTLCHNCEVPIRSVRFSIPETLK